MIMYDFECSECGTVFEDLVEPGTEFAPCEECQRPAHRLMPAPMGRIGGYDGLARTRSQLEKRSNDYDNSPQGKEEREKVAARLNARMAEGKG